MSMEDPRGPRMTDRECRKFTELLRLHCGLDCGPETRWALASRIARRVCELELGSFSAYHYLIRSASGAEEFAQLIDGMLSDETYFFRDRGQLNALIHQIIPESLKEPRAHGGDPVSLWSAGCASGDEPYSVVMLALEAGLVPRTDFRIYASDISRRMLRCARRGTYGANSLREIEPTLRRRYFHDKDGLWRISDAVKKHVDFIQLNLMDPAKLALIRNVDVILCRNVLANLDSECKQRTIEMFWDKLRPGGHLLLGDSESLVGLSTSFELRRLKDELVYRKPSSGIGLRDPWHAAAETVRARDAAETDD